MNNIYEGEHKNPLRRNLKEQIEMGPIREDAWMWMKAQSQLLSDSGVDRLTLDGMMSYSGHP